ncbi:MAG: aconitase X catalytic domain-containing protein [Candidatus Rokubacteria bacterium]|nr:aconitase X catalytic domain-containing protein [Candidatus Rokubacteria bacterium]
MELTREEERMLNGDCGEPCRWALSLQVETGKFFGATRMLSVRSAHMMADIEILGPSGVAFLERLMEQGARARVLATLNPGSVDFAAAERLRQDPAMVEFERKVIALCRKMGFIALGSCVLYQTAYQPHRGEHLAWGDTGTVIWANSVIGARSNFESGPAALAAALTGRVPDYGFHRDECRAGTVLVDVTTELADLADWGALGALIGRQLTDYWAVPVISVLNRSPLPDELKHFGAALAAWGSIAMFHMPPITTEARTVAEAFGGRTPERTIRVGAEEIDGVYRWYVPDRREVDLVVFSAPQLSVFELRMLAELLDGRTVHENTRLIVTTDAMARAAGERLGYVDAIERAGGLVLDGTCFYHMAIGDMRRTFGWRSVLTNSAKLANIVPSYQYQPILRRTATCIEAAVQGRLAE